MRANLNHLHETEVVDSDGAVVRGMGVRSLKREHEAHRCTVLQAE